MHKPAESESKNNLLLIFETLTYEPYIPRYRRRGSLEVQRHSPRVGESVHRVRESVHRVEE